MFYFIFIKTKVIFNVWECRSQGARCGSENQKWCHAWARNTYNFPFLQLSHNTSHHLTTGKTKQLFTNIRKSNSGMFSNLMMVFISFQVVYIHWNLVYTVLVHPELFWFIHNGSTKNKLNVWTNLNTILNIQ